MQKIRIVALGEDKYSIVKTLQRMGVIDIRKSKLELEDDVQMPSIAAISDQVVRMKSALAIIGDPKRGEVKVHAEHMALPQLLEKSTSNKGADEVFRLYEEKKALLEKQKLLSEALEIAETLDGLDVDFGKLKCGALAFRAFVVGTKAASKVGEMLSSKGIRHELRTKALKGNRTVIFVAYEKAKESLMDEALKAARPVELDINNKHLNSKPERVVRELKAEKDTDSKRLVEIDVILKNKDKSVMAGIAEMLDVEYERANISEKFKRTGRTFVIEGWIPKDRLDDLGAEMKKTVSGRFDMEEVNDDELAPTYTRRPKILEPFDYLMEFFSLPRSDEIDPTYLFIGALAISYGIMVSDVGYGLMSFLLAWWLVKKTDEDSLLNNVAKIWRLFSIPIIFFGIISNEYLGFQLAPFNGIKIFDWVTNVPMLIFFTLMIGFVEVMIGLAIGFVNKYRHNEKKLAYSKLLSIAAMIFGFIAIGGLLFNAFGTTLAEVSAGLGIVSFLGAAALSGIEAAELPALIAHPLSYTRLLGFGLASIVLSVLIDKAFTPTLSHGLITFVAFLIMFIMLHAMNMILSIFEGLVQGARLNFIELFSKFYLGGGVKYRPYYFKRRYTKENR